MNYFIYFYLFILLILILVALEIVRSVKRRQEKYLLFLNRWKSLMIMAKNKKQWNQLVIEAEELLDDVLKYKKYKGKNVADKIVAAQRQFKNNDQLWSCHQLVRRIKEENFVLEDKKQLLEVISGYRQALEDLGVFKKEKS
jgi:hypothetical protein